MGKRIAINGLGRIGRLALRRAWEDESLELVAVNDIAPIEDIAYLIRHDSEHGPLGEGRTCIAEHGGLVLDGKAIPAFCEADASNLPWSEVGVDLVLDCTGTISNRTKAEAHLRAGADKVLISAAAGSDVPTIVFGVNDHTLSLDERIVSGASCSTVGLSYLANALNAIAPIQAGVSTTTHALTPTQMVLDNPQRKHNLRRSRTALSNIIPTSAKAAQAVGLVLPELSGKLTGSAIRVPVSKGSFIQLVATVAIDQLDAKTLNERMRALCVGTFGYAEEELVSSDIAGTSLSAIFDPFQTRVLPVSDGLYLVEVAVWFDNETSYVARYMDLARHMLGLPK